MKLDRNTNRGGHGKYALVNMRKIVPLIEKEEMERVDFHSKTAHEISESERDLAAFKRLVERGIISLGNETPGDQFFVVKYKDKFAHVALDAYAKAVYIEAFKIGEKRNELFEKLHTEGKFREALDSAQPLTAEELSLMEYGSQMFREAEAARELGNRIPD